MVSRMPTATGAPAIVALLLGACVGSIEGGMGFEPGGGEPGSGGTAGSPPPGSEPSPLPPAQPLPPSAEACAPGKVQLGRTPMRRLSHAEYNHTVADLLGDATAPASAFPADVASFGYDNNADRLEVTTILAEDYLATADALATRAVGNLAALLPCDPAKTGEDACAGQFVAAFGKRAFRRPLSSEEAANLLAVYRSSRQGGDDFATGIRLTITAALLSPQFLFRAEIGAGQVADGAVKLTGYEVASRLSYLLWASMPDDELLRAADAGQLATDAEVRAQAMRMLGDPRFAARARRGLARFSAQWIPASAIPANLTKDPAQWRDWTAATPALLKTELAAFIDHVTWQDGGKFATFLQAPYTLLDRELAAFYRAKDPTIPAITSATPVKVALDPARYAGFMTRAGVMALEAGPATSKPIRRGVFFRDRLLCDPVPPPVPDPKVDQARAELDKPAAANETERQRLERVITDVQCVSCHRVFNDLGLAFENFDASGRWRAQQAGQAIVTAGVLVGTELEGPFAGHTDLLGKVAQSRQGRECFVKQVFRYAAGRGETVADACTLATLNGAGAASDYDVRQVMLAMVSAPGFLYRAP